MDTPSTQAAAPRPITTTYGNPPSDSESRSSRAAQVATQVLPNALQVGLQEVQAARTAAAAASSATAATTATRTVTTGWLGTASTSLGVLGGLAGAYNIATQWGKSSPTAGAASGAAVGAAVGSVVPGLGTAFGAAIGLVAGGLMGCVRSGKHPDQKVRDSVRSALVNAGIIDKNYSIKLANGSSYDIGKDGGPRAEFGGRRPYELDWNNPVTGQVVSWLNPVVDLISNGNEKVRTDFVGYFTNAAMSNATTLQDAKKNVEAIMQQFGVDDKSLLELVSYGQKTGRITPDVAAAYQNGIRERQSV